MTHLSAARMGEWSEAGVRLVRYTPLLPAAVARPAFDYCLALLHRSVVLGPGFRDLLATDNADTQAFDNQLLLFQVHFDGGELGVFGNQPDLVTFALEALDRHFVIDAGHHYLPVVCFTCGVHGQ